MATHDSCPLPDRTASPRDDAAAIARMLLGQRIAVVGLSDDPSRPSYEVAQYLQSIGKEIIPVNPRCDAILGCKCYRSLEEIPGHVDVVDVFRRSEFCPAIARSAVAIKAGGVWLQSGVVSHEAQAIAREAGIDFVQDRCLKVEQYRKRMQR